MDKKKEGKRGSNNIEKKGIQIPGQNWFGKLPGNFL